ncbi:HU family DNA-binding protein [Thermodesulfatator atlanticus]
MRKSDLVEKLSQELKISKRKAKLYVDAFFETLESELLRGEKVVFQNFGSFEVKEYHERNFFNPRTGEKKILPGKVRLRFKPSKKLLERINR